MPRYYYSIGKQIKKIIKCRNRTIHQTADEMGIKYTTFSAQLNNDTLSAETLFRLAAYLDIDLNWMQAVLGYYGPVSPLARESIPRMGEDLRESEKVFVTKRLKEIIKENPASTADVRRELLNEFHGNMFYLLDVLIPEEYEIIAVSERGIIRYYVDTHEPIPIRQLNMPVMRRKPIQMLFQGKEALDVVIEEMKEQ